MQTRQIFAREAEQLAEYAQWERPGKGCDKVDLAGGRQRVEQLADGPPDDRFESRDPPRRKSFGHEAADPVVERRVDLDDVGHLAVPARAPPPPRLEAASRPTSTPRWTKRSRDP